MRTRHRVPAMLALLGTAIICLAPATSASVLQAAPAASQLRTLGSGAWSWFGDPRAIHVQDPATNAKKVIVGYISPSGAVMVGSINLQNGRQFTTTIGHLFHDDHSDPSLLLEPDHRITAFYSGHNGNDMFYRTTVRPADISQWQAARVVPWATVGTLGFTYPNPVTLPAENNKTYVFARGSNWEPWVITRDVRGHWSRSKQLIDSPGERPYVKVASNNSDRIGLAFTNGHPRNVLTSIYFVQYRHGRMETVTGRDLGAPGATPIHPSGADVVYNAGATGVGAWVWDVAFAKNGDPVIVYATFPHGAQSHEYWYARWDGHAWQRHRLAIGGPTISPGTIEYEYSGGLVLDHNNPSVVYMSRDINGHWQIEKWETASGGRSWNHQELTRGNANNYRPVVVRGTASGPENVLWMRGSYGTYTTYHTSIVYNPKGMGAA